MEIISKYFEKNRIAATRLQGFSLVAFTVLFAAIFIAPFAAQIHAEHTRHWRQASFEDFSRGKANGIALRSDGRLELAPRFATFVDADCAFLWALRLDSRGNLYAAGGSNAKVLRMDAAGKAKTIFDSSELVAQALAIDSHDNLYVGTSPDGKVYKITPTGEKNVFFEPKTKYIWDLVVDPSGTLYAATGDKGQIFAVSPEGKSELFYSGTETHIRALAFDANGNLIAGTEPNGLILRVPRGPSSAVTTKADTSSQRLAGNTANNAASSSEKQSSASTQENARKAFVLYETPKKEITALLSDSAGNIYAAAIGEKQRPGHAISPSLSFPPPVSLTSPSGGITISSTAPMQQSAIISPFPAAVTSAAFRIASDGAPEEIWSSRETLAYSLGLSPRGKLLLGTGNDGSIIEIEGGGVFANLVKVGAAQVTGFARAPTGKIYLIAANPGKVFTLGPEFESEGSFESQTFDARMFSEWGRLQWFGDGAARGSAANTETSNIAFYVRSGNTSDPGKDWSAWAGPYLASGERIESPPARFVQWKAQWKARRNVRPSMGLRTQLNDSSTRASEKVSRNSGANDGIDWVSIAYLPKNVAPVIDAILVQNPGVRIQNSLVISAQLQQSVPVKMPPQTNPSGGITISSNPSPSERGSPKFEPAPQGTQQKGFQSVVWSAHDDNEDELTYSVYYRGEGERDWKLLKDKIEQKYFSWDTASLPDGAYYLKIVASDAASNPRSEALKAERESERFEIDNTPPVIGSLSARMVAENSSVRIQFEARDSASTIERAEYSMDGGEWILIPPVGRLSDAPRERYDFPLTGLPPGEHTIAVRAFDHFENTASGKTTFRILPGKSK